MVRVLLRTEKIIDSYNSDPDIRNALEKKNTLGYLMGIGGIMSGGIGLGLTLGVSVK